MCYYNVKVIITATSETLKVTFYPWLGSEEHTGLILQLQGPVRSEGTLLFVYWISLWFLYPLHE